MIIDVLLLLEDYPGSKSSNSLAIIRNHNFSKVGTGTGTITFQKSEPEPESDAYKKVTVPQHCTGSTCFWASSIRIRIHRAEVWILIRILLWIRIRILLLSCQKSKKNLDSY
jgi:hypothetical protein